MDIQTLLASFDFARTKLLAILDTIEKSGQDMSKVLAWRPGPGRAHIAWQFMHCAATHHRHVYVTFRGGKPKDEALVAGYAGGSTPSDQNIPDIATIRKTLAENFDEFRTYMAALKSDELTTRKVGPPDRQRLLGDLLILYIWHEAHHQGQIHLTWNLYKAAHGIA